VLEVRQKAVPVLVHKSRVLGKFTLDHQRLNVIDGMDVSNAVFYNLANLHLCQISSCVHL
jgi:hypothetical protein